MFRLTAPRIEAILLTRRLSVFGLSYLFYPWGYIVQILAIVHFVRRRPETYWFFIIFFGGFLGASVYIVAEVLPDLGLLRGVFQGFGRRSRIQKVETDISFAGKLRRTGRALQRSGAVCQGARSIYPRNLGAERLNLHLLFPCAVFPGDE